LTFCLATLQVSQVKAEADKQVAHLTSSLKQVQSQAAGISRERERLAAQVQQQAAKPACCHTSLFKQEQLVILPYPPLHSLVAGCLHDAKQLSTVIVYNSY